MIKKFVKYLSHVSGLEIRKIEKLERRAKNIFNKYRTYTMLNERMYISNLLLINDFSRIEGCIVECGVWRGGMIAGIAEIIPNREYYLFDSFEGLPKAKKIDGESALAWQKDVKNPAYFDNCKAEMEDARQVMEKTGAKYNIVKGWFSQTLKNYNFENNIAILRLDADWYDSTMECLIHLFPQVIKGGLIIFDDYYTWDGCSRAVHDYLSKLKSISRIHKTPMGVAFIIKMD